MDHAQLEGEEGDELGETDHVIGGPAGRGEPVNRLRPGVPRVEGEQVGQVEGRGQPLPQGVRDMGDVAAGFGLVDETGLPVGPVGAGGQGVVHGGEDGVAEGGGGVVKQEFGVEGAGVGHLVDAGDIGGHGVA